MIVWFIVVVSIITGMVLLTLLRKSKLSSIESFQNTSGKRASTMEDFVKSLGGGNVKTTLLDATMPFKKLEQNYYNDIVGKELLKSDIFPDFTRMVELVVTQPDAYLNNKADTMDVKNIVADNSNKFTNADIKWCKSAKMPAYLPPHLKGASIGCGWYYIPDPNLTSSGALGQVDGPIFPNGPRNDGVNSIPNYGSGQWIWNLAIAQQLEDIKNCKRIKSCIAIDAPSVNNICGFCESTGYAIPTNSDGSEKYPASRKAGNITAPAANCDTTPVMNSGSCYVPPTPVVTPDGIDCGTYGYPSPDYSIRLYTQPECVDNMGGDWMSTGECLMMGGGSYSAKCSVLNGVKPKSPIPQICEPDSAGKLSTGCLISLAKSIGLTTSGSIIQMLQSAAAPGQRDNVAIKLLKEQNVNVDPVLYKGGVITVANAIAGYDSIYNLIKSGSTPFIQNAAMWLCIGTNNFDPCDLDDNASGPFFPECVQQAWRIAGCQPAGKDYPSQPAALDQLNTLTWGQVNTKFQNKYKAMTTETDPDRQDTAIQKCLGITPSRPPPPPPIFKSSGPLKDIGSPGEGIGLVGDQSTYTDIIFTLVPQEWLAPPDNNMRTFINSINANLKTRPVIATVISNNGDKFSGQVVGPIYYPPFDGPWGGSFKIQKPGPVNPIGDYYVKQNGGRNTPEFAAWDNATSATLILTYT